MKTLCALSGGRDTANVLWTLLTETDDEVLALRFGLGEVYGNREFDRISHHCAMRIADWLRGNVRPFEFRYVPLSSFTEGGWHGTEFVFEGVRLLDDGAVDRIIGGWNREQQAIPGRGALNREIMEKLFAKLATRGSLEFPLEARGKAHVLAELPPALEALCVTCKTPEIDDAGNVHACGRCWYCNRLEECRDRLARGETADAITDNLVARDLAAPPRPSYHRTFLGSPFWGFLDSQGITLANP